MGESACLVRSFSHPSESSREAKQGDPFCALGESISFGRFMTEPLAWEKWSAFSHNRYLEEVERFSKPGSVAQKKAYFEAHYRKKAAERAAALNETVNVVASHVSGPVTNNINCNNFLADSDLANGENHVDGQLEKDDPNDKVVYPANMSECNSNVERNDLDVDMVEGAEVVAQQGISMENSNKVEVSNQFVNEEDYDKIVADIEEKIVDNELDVSKVEGAEVIIQEGIDLENSNKVEISSQFVTKEVHNEIVANEEEKIVNNEWDVAMVEGTEVVIQEGIDLENPNKVETSSQFVSNEDHHKIVANIEEKIHNKQETAGQENEILALTSKKRLANSSSKISTQNRPSKVLLSSSKQSNVIAPRSKKSVEYPIDKKKLSVKSLQKSVQFSSHFVESNTTSSAIQKFGNSRISTTSLNISKNTSSPLKTITRLQASVSRVLKRPSVDLQTEDKRTKSLLSKSVAGGLTADQKWKSLSTDHLKYPSGNGSKLRSSMTFSPFSFRSEERAAKRKEFFQKLEEKKIAEETENKHLETRPQEKKVQGVKKMLQSTGLKARPDEDLSSGSHLPRNHMKKIPLTRPRSPRLGRKSTYSKVLDSSNRRPSANTKSPKCIVEKNKQSTKRSATSRSPKNAYENASPNIQN